MGSSPARRRRAVVGGSALDRQDGTRDSPSVIGFRYESLSVSRYGESAINSHCSPVLYCVCVRERICSTSPKISSRRSSETSSVLIIARESATNEWGRVNRSRHSGRPVKRTRLPSMLLDIFFLSFFFQHFFFLLFFFQFPIIL